MIILLLKPLHFFSEVQITSLLMTKWLLSQNLPCLRKSHATYTNMSIYCNSKWEKKITFSCIFVSHCGAHLQPVGYWSQAFWVRMESVWDTQTMWCVCAAHWLQICSVQLSTSVDVSHRHVGQISDVITCLVNWIEHDKPEHLTSENMLTARTLTVTTQRIYPFSDGKKNN